MVYMLNKLKALFKNTYFNIFLILSLAGVVLFFTLKNDGKEVIQILSRISIPGLLFLVVLMVLEKVMLGWGLMLECRQSHPEYTWKQGIINAYVAGLFCNITPGASGGQVGQGYIFRKQGIPVTHSIGILWLDFIVYQSVMTLFVLFLILMRFSYYYTNYSQFFLIVIFGFMISSGIIFFLWLLASSPRFYTWITTTGISIGAKIHLVKDKEKTLENLERQLQMFSKEIVVLKTHRKMIAMLAVEDLLRLILYYSVPYWCALVLHIPIGPEKLLDVIALSSFVAMVNAFLPMPGSSGGTEATFILMFSTIFDRADAASIMILWRLVTFYQVLIIGGAVFLYAKSQKDIPIVPEEITPRTYSTEAMKEESK